VPWALSCLLGGCPTTSPPPEAPSCDELDVVVAPATPPDRRLLGEAAPYAADGMLAARYDELHRSQRARREAAWRVVERVLTPVPLATPTPVSGATVPVFRTWYDRDDVQRLFQHLYEGLGPERRAARAPFEDGELDAAFGWNVHVVDGLESWPASRFESYVAGLDQVAIDGLGGIRRIGLSPDAARHVVASYAEVLRCMREGAPPAFVDGTAAEQRVVRAPISLARCDEHVVGPFFVASGATLAARLEGVSPGSEATVGAAAVAVLASEDGLPGAARCEGEGIAGCASTGPGAFFVRVTASGQALDAQLEVTLSSPAAPAPGCVRGPFPMGAATIAAHWQRADLGMPLPTYDTSGDALRARLEGDPTWGSGDGAADPGPDAIYTMSVPAGPRFRLAGFHIRTRELDHWMNVTLWWSPDPDTDFGADRPSSIRALGGPWASYKMCVAMEYDELDPEPGGGFEADAPTLADALAAVHEGQGGPSWCTNPYIDAAPGLLRSNCVGCHQHALSGLRPGEVALDAERFPQGGRTETRNNAPADGFWAFDAGDDLGAVLRDTVSWWDAAEP
jgi:hypothetical protein